jgi:ubiquinone/menaquinone biosynthesis C-methylase UbiE
MLRQTLDELARRSPRFRRVIIRAWYESIGFLDRERNLTFMNYGYSDPDLVESQLPLNDEEKANRYAIQLYHHVTAAVDLRDKDVAEIGSGRGGGAAYLARHLKPRSMVGIDISQKAIAFCHKHYSEERLSFVHGDAENIPLADNAVDAIINLESSHCYGSMTRFLNEVRRVLRPGGFFLFSDHRDQDRAPILREQLQRAGFKTMNETDITGNVVQALELDHDRKKELIRRKCPKFLLREAEEFAALKGTRAFESFKAGDSRYFSFVLLRDDGRCFAIGRSQERGQ